MTKSTNPQLKIQWRNQQTHNSKSNDENQLTIKSESNDENQQTNIFQVTNDPAIDEYTTDILVRWKSLQAYDFDIDFIK